jgi:RNA polymerase sigma-70 factor (ECF subfamily)
MQHHYIAVVFLINAFLELTANTYYNDLVERCKLGDHRSYNQLYEQYAKAMFSTCYRLLNNFAEAEDILQESFSEAFRHLEDFQYKSSFGAWLKQIVINKSINHLKKKKLDWIELTPDSADQIIEDEQVDEESIELRVKDIRDCIQELPTGYRTVLTLYLLEGYDHEEISEILRISHSTTRSQYKRAKEKLLTILKNLKKYE